LASERLGELTLPAALIDREGRPFTVRRLRPEDRPALHAMYASFEPKRGAQSLPPREDGIARWLDHVLAAGEHLGVFVDGQIAGHAMLLPIEDGRAELANFLHQSVRNRGIGTVINRIVLDVARSAGLASVWLCVEPFNRAAIGPPICSRPRRRRMITAHTCAPRTQGIRDFRPTTATRGNAAARQRAGGVVHGHGSGQRRRGGGPAAARAG
jgi:RimJ/RimL family protein N-acetyltransferase